MRNLLPTWALTGALITSVISSLLTAQTIQPSKAPTTIPDSRMESISREMLLQQSAVSTLQSAQLEVAKFLAAPQASYNESTVHWTKFLDALRKEFHAEGCELTVEKTWDCTKRDKDKVDAEAVAVAPKTTGSPK